MITGRGDRGANVDDGEKDDEVALSALVTQCPKPPTSNASSGTTKRSTHVAQSTVTSDGPDDSAESPIDTIGKPLFAKTPEMTKPIDPGAKESAGKSLRRAILRDP